MQNEQTQNSILLYTTAKECLDTCMVAPGVPLDVGCASSVNAVVQKAFGAPVGGGASTYLLLQDLIDSPDFIEITEPLAGDIIISATGTSSISNTPIEGHTGIVGNFGIMSNNSENGLWQEYFTLQSWAERYVTAGGYQMRFFRRK